MRGKGFLRDEAKYNDAVVGQDGVTSPRRSCSSVRRRICHRRHSRQQSLRERLLVSGLTDPLRVIPLGQVYHLHRLLLVTCSPKDDFVNTSTLAMTDCSFSNTSVVGNNGVYFTANNGGNGRGGAIYNLGALTLTRCTFKRISTGNDTRGGAGATAPDDGVLRPGGVGGSGLGGAIFNANGASLIVHTCTSAEDTGVGGAGENGFTGGNCGTGVGAIHNEGMMTATNRTWSRTMAAAEPAAPL